MAQEQILVIPRTELGDFIDFHGFKPVETIHPELWIPVCTFKSRNEMEQNPFFKQLIPYILLRHHSKVYRYRRTKRGGEDRLHHLYSLGIGGHINPQDDNLFTQSHEILQEAAERELQEELNIASSYTIKMIGFINDDTSDVGRVHLGIVYEAWLAHDQVSIRESALSQGEWKDFNDLNDGSDYETWSQFLIEDYLAKPVSNP